MNEKIEWVVQLIDFSAGVNQPVKLHLDLVAVKSSKDIEDILAFLKNLVGHIYIENIKPEVNDEQ